MCFQVCRLLFSALLACLQIVNWYLGMRYM